MAAQDLILKGPLSLGLTSASAVDVSCEVTGVTITGTVADVAIPATLCAGKSHAGGASKYEIDIDYLSTDGTGGTLFPLLWSAVITASKEMFFSCNLRDGATSGANPLWSGTFVVGAADVGGDQETLSTGSIKCTMTAAPTVAYS
jgi:hypothetical protein